MPEQTTFVSFLKGVFYKSCFCIGLGTISVWAFSSPNSAKPVETTTLQDKVLTLVAQPALMDETRTQPATKIVYVHDQAPTPVVKTSVLSAVEANKDAAALALAPDPNASPAPSASPGAVADKDKKDGEVKDGEKKPEETKTEEQLAQEATDAANAAPTPGQPYPLQNPAATVDAPSPTDKDKEKALADAQAAGSAGAGVALGSTLAGSSSAVGSGTSTATGSGSDSSSSNLTAADITALTLGIKATLPDAAPKVTGQVCSVGSDGSTTSDCTYNNAFQIHTGRWNTQYGVSTDAGFSISSSSNTKQIKISFTFKYQDLQQQAQSANSSVYPTEVLTHVESRNGKQYKVYDIKMTGVNGLNGDRLANVEATLNYEMSASGTIGALSSDSKVIFTRSNVLTTGSDWDLNSANRAPAANEQVITATSIPYSMTLEKSQ